MIALILAAAVIAGVFVPYVLRLDNCEHLDVVADAGTDTCTGCGAHS